jgi:hypothetical protein
MFVDAVFNVSQPGNNLNITVYGNVTGQVFKDTVLPLDPNSTYWTNPNKTDGKIIRVSPSNGIQSTLFAHLNVLTFGVYNPPPAPFCDAVINGQCPISPTFNVDPTSPANFPAYTVAHQLLSTYAFTTINTQTQVETGDASKDLLACVNIEVTPPLGNTIQNLLVFLPLVVLKLVGVATASAAIFSPWGTWDVFRWTSNYGRDPDQLRLITPGFGDCLQYLQFILLSGSLSLNYPGFYQPAVSQISWSALMFNESFVTGMPGSPAIIDGMYVTNGTYGLDRMSQLVGMNMSQDIWGGMMVWLLVVIGAVLLAVQVGFLGRWLYRFVSNTQEEDLRAKNLPFSSGNVIRVVFNYFLLPLVSFSMYQLLIAGSSKAVVVALAAVTLLISIGFAVWLLRIIITTKPRSYLFDDLPTVLLYGPLYNTYSDNAATFALIPLLLAFVRGIAIGAVQSSGIAQIVLLAVCEVVFILTLNAFRPFHSPTSMNAYHTIFAIVRLITVMLMVSFVPQLSVDPAARGWIGYIILLMHGITLFIGFFIHSLQTLIEVIARLMGAGGEDGAAARGGLVKVCTYAEHVAKSMLTK